MWGNPCLHWWDPLVPTGDRDKLLKRDGSDKTLRNVNDDLNHNFCRTGIKEDLGMYCFTVDSKNINKSIKETCAPKTPAIFKVVTDPPGNSLNDVDS